MKSIYKYTLHPGSGTPEVQVPLPKGARVLSAIGQRGEIVVYAEVEAGATITEGEVDIHRFFVYGTGFVYTPPEGANFLGTVSLFEGSLIFHVFVISPTT